MEQKTETQDNHFKDRTTDFAGERMSEENTDDRVIFDMNVEGMPGYRPELSKGTISKGEPSMSKRETRQFILTATLTGLLVAAVFSAVLILFTLFCTQIWFK